MDTESIINNPRNLYFDKFLAKAEPGSPDETILDIFSYGTWMDYKKVENTLPERLQLKPGSVGENTLKMLTITSYFTQKDYASFEELAEIIDVKHQIELENVVCDAISYGLIEGQINELTQNVECIRVTSRCIRNNPEDISMVYDNIEQIRKRIADVLVEYAK
jgi:hypothetical protein